MQTNKRRLRILFLLALFGMMIGMTPVMVHAYENPNVTIPEIQGDGFESPFPYNTYVDTYGIVTSDLQAYGLKGGFFVQDPVGDGNPATSDGIFCYNYWYDVNVGDEVLLTGRVREYYGLTQLYAPYVTILSSGNPLPDPIELNPPFDDYDSDVYYEALEGMLVSVECMRAVAGTNQYGEAAGVVADTDVKRVFQDDPAGTGGIIFTDDVGGYLVNARTGNMIKNLVGPLDYTYDEYKVLPSADNPPEVTPEWWAESDFVWPRGLRCGFTVATYNLYNLFDEVNTPDKDDPIYSSEEVELLLSKHANAIYDYLRLPDLIAVQEVENLEILQRLADTAPIQGLYGAVLIDGPDGRGIDVGLLYRLDRVEIKSVEARQTCTDLDDLYGPGTDPNFPCDEGYNPLFSRPPLVVHLKTLVSGHGWKYKHGTDLWVIINHFKSKGVYPPTYADPEPRRIQQAEWVTTLVDEIQDINRRAKVIVLGDLNTFSNEVPVYTLEDSGLNNLILKVRKQTRYTYIYRGVSEVLDYIMVTKSLKRYFKQARIVHFNVDFPFELFTDDPNTGIRSSDHDVFMCSFWIR
ncbi:MAG: endonuclease/exonuclease/phosphatase family protein [Candidatus Thorarchaeota archaeon]